MHRSVVLGWKRGSDGEACGRERNKQRGDEDQPPSVVSDFAASRPYPPSAVEHLTGLADTLGLGRCADRCHRGGP
jgi:hypothetical protein